MSRRYLIIGEKNGRIRSLEVGVEGKKREAPADAQDED